MRNELTGRQRDVLRLAGEGKSNKEIAGMLGLSQNAVRFHLKNLHAELETGSDRLRLRMRAWQRLRSWAAGVPILKHSQALLASTAVVGFSVVGLAGVMIGHSREPGPTSPPPAIITIRTWPGATVHELAGGDPSRIQQIHTLNPGLPSGPLPPGIDVKVPQVGEGTRAQIFPTPHP